MMDKAYPDDKFPEVLKALRKPGKSKQLYWKENSIKVDFLAWLESGYAVAFGIQVQPVVDSIPHEIPAAVFKSLPPPPKSADAVGWDRDQVQSGATIYGDVRVLFASELSKTTEESKRGRPPKMGDVKRAATLLKTREQDFCSMNRKAAVELVRDALKGLSDLENPSSIHASDATIRSAIKSVCDNNGVKK